VSPSLLVTTHDQEWVDESKVKVDGAAYNVSSASDGSEVLVGTAAGFMYRVKLGARGSSPSVLQVCESHSSAAASLEEGLGRARTTASGTKQTSASRATTAVGGVAAVAYAANVSDKFATVGYDNTVRVWDAGDYTVPVKCSVKHGGHPSSVAYSIDALLSGWEDGQIRCHSVDNGEQLWTVADAHRGGVTSLLMSNNQRFAVRVGWPWLCLHFCLCLLLTSMVDVWLVVGQLTGGVHGEVRVWELRSREMVAHLKEHTMSVTGMVRLATIWHSPCAASNLTVSGVAVHRVPGPV